MTIPTPSSSPILLSKCIVFPDQPSSVADLKLSVSDLPMLSCHYIQKGCLFTSTNLDQISLLDLLKSGLSRALSRFPPLAGRLVTDDHGYVYIKCNDAGVEFIHANACDGPEVTFSNDVPLRERIFSFSRESILKLKAKTNEKKLVDNGDLTVTAVEIMAKQSNDMYCQNNGKVGSIFDSWYKNDTVTKQHADSEAISMTTISSFQSLCALLWRSVTRARKLPPNKTTTFRMAVNCRHRLEPKLDPYYFGNAIQSIPTYASVGDVLSRDLRWCAEKLNENVIAHDNGMKIRTIIEKVT
ncbi:Putrescine hydroxycinnamoyltransferase 3, partial [Cucurbita argyrosperma subsp. argyrosperma]